MKVSPCVPKKCLGSCSHSLRPALFQNACPAKRQSVRGHSCLEASTALARSRAEHSRTAQPLFHDPYALALAEIGFKKSNVSEQIAYRQSAFPIKPAYSRETLYNLKPLPNDCRGEGNSVLDAVATRYIDEQLLKGLSLVNMDLKQEYRQVVLVGCGMDTRPYRCK